MDNSRWALVELIRQTRSTLDDLQLMLESIQDIMISLGDGEGTRLITNFSVRLGAMQEDLKKLTTQQRLLALRHSNAEEQEPNGSS